MALFVERARFADDAFELSPSNATAVAALCVAMDGLPPGIELAAARIRTLPPNILLAHLDQRLDLLTGPRDAPARQHSLRSVLDWSYDLLGPAERAVLRRMGIFAGGAYLEALADLCAPTDEAQMLPVVAGLVDK